MREDLRLSPIPPEPTGRTDILRPYPVGLLQAARARKLRRLARRRGTKKAKSLTDSPPR